MDIDMADSSAMQAVALDEHQHLHRSMSAFKHSLEMAVLSMHHVGPPGAR